VEQLLQDLNDKHCTKLTGWLAELVANSPGGSDQDLVDTWLPRRYAIIEESTRSWIYEIISNLKEFADDYNNKDTNDHLPIATEPAHDIFTLPCRRDPSSEPFQFRCYQGLLTTYNWALVIRSYYECLQVLLVPTDRLLSLQTNSSTCGDVKPLAEFRPAVNGEDVLWSLGGVPVGPESVPKMCRELFADFIKVARQSVDASALVFPAKPTVVEETHVLSSETEVLVNAKIKDLQVWQARVLFLRALKQDLETLGKLDVEPTLDASEHSQIAKLSLEIAQLQKDWLAVLAQLPVQTVLSHA
jgi:hypothetical protein